MSLENRVLRNIAVTTTSSAGLLLSLLSYQSFKENDISGAGIYALFAAGNIFLSFLFYGRNVKKFDQEETGFFGVPDKVIRDGWKRDSGRYKSP